MTASCSWRTPAAVAARSRRSTRPASPSLHSASPATAVRPARGRGRGRQPGEGQYGAVHNGLVGRCNCPAATAQHSTAQHGTATALPGPPPHLPPGPHPPAPCQGTARGAAGPAPPAASRAGRPARRRRPAAAAGSRARCRLHTVAAEWSGKQEEGGRTVRNAISARKHFNRIQLAPALKYWFMPTPHGHSHALPHAAPVPQRSASP